jgi:hypothetical protein
MGKLDKGILGGFNGKVGTVIGGKWRGVEYIRHKGPSKRKNNSPGQVEQQARFARAFKFVRRMSKLFKITFRNYAQQMTARNNALAVTVKEAIIGDYPNFEIDYSKVLISRGILETELNATVTSAAGILTWKWDANEKRNGGDPKDQCIIVAFCPEYNHCAYQVHGPARSANEATLDVVPFMGKTVHTWLAFITEDGSKLSDSVFTGQLVVA